MKQFIKTYEKVDRKSNQLSFRIAKMEDIYEERNGIKDDPHRHDYYTLLFIERAKGKHIIDFNEYLFSLNQVFFVSPGHVHQVIEDEKPSGYVILFSTEFLIKNNIALHFIDDLNLFNDHGESPPLELEIDELSLLSRFCNEMLEINQTNMKYKDQAISSYLKLFLINCNNLCTLQIDNTQNHQAANSILKNFKNLVNEKYAEWHQSNDYAKELNISPDHLNRVVKSLVGKTSKDFIQSRLIVAAKRLLYFSELSAKEIGYQLGFSEPANFSAFFKKNTGLPPSEFKKKS